MSQPPQIRPDSSARLSPPAWRRPRGLAAGTWEYVNQRSIADHYDAFVADTPLCRLDAEILRQSFPQVSQHDNPPLVLDLGCGSGRACLALADRGYDVVAIDLSTRMLQLTVEKASASRPPGRVCPLRANLVELDCLADCSAQHAVCLFSTIGMIQGRANRREMLRHVARILHPGGRFLLHAHNLWMAFREPGGVVRLAASAWRSFRDPEMEFGDAAYPYRGLDQMFMHRFTRRELLRDLRDCGFQVDVVWPISVDGGQADPDAKIPGGFIVLSQVQSRREFA